MASTKNVGPLLLALLLVAFAAGMASARTTTAHRALLEEDGPAGGNVTSEGAATNKTVAPAPTTNKTTTIPAPSKEVNATTKEVKKEEDIEKQLTLATAAFQAANLTFNASTPATLFAPTDAAIRAWAKKLNVSNVNDLRNATFLPFSINVTQLHVVPGSAIAYNNITQGKNYYVTSLLGPTLKIYKTGKGSVSVTVNGTNSSAEVSKADLRFNSTIVHVINKVLVPPFPST